METSLLTWAIIFLVIALVAGVFGFGFISGISIVFAKWLFIIFIALFIISIIYHFLRRV